MSASIWDGASGGVIEVVDADNTYLQQQYTSVTEGQTVFVLTSFNYAVGTNSLRVYVNGTRQVVGRDYLETNSSSFTFVSGLQSEDIVDAEGVVGTEGAQNAIEVAEAAAAAAQAALDAILNLELPSMPLTISNGGTGQVTKAEGFKALAPIPVANSVIGSLDGVNFQMLPSGIASSVDISASTNLTAANIGYHLLTPTALGMSISLPSALTMLAGSPRAIFDNTSGAYHVAIRNFNNQLITAIAPGGIAHIGLKDNTTANGAWSVLGDRLQPGIISADSLFSSTVTGVGFAPFCAFTNSVSIHFVANATNGFSAFIVDNLSKVIISPQTVTIAAGSIPCQCFRISATQCILFYGTTTSFNSVVITLTGTTPSFAFTLGTPVTLSVSGLAAWDGETSLGAPKIVQMSNLTSFIASYFDSSSAKVVGFTVSGTTITAGTPVVLGANPVNPTLLFALTGTTAVCLNKQNVSAPYNVNCYHLSLAGTVITVAANVSTGLTSGNSGVSSFTLLAPNKFIILDDGASFNVNAVVGTVTGTVIAYGASVTVFNTALGNIGYDFVTNRYAPHLTTLSSTTALAWIQLPSGNASDHVILTESAGTLTIGVHYLGLISNDSTQTATGNGRASPLVGDVIPAILQEASAAGTYRKRFVVSKVVGTGFTSGYGVSLPELNNSTTVATDTITRLLSGDFIAASSYASTALTVLRTNGAAVNYRGSIDLPKTLTSTLLPLAVGTNRAVFVCQGQQISAVQTRVFNVEIAI